MHYIVLCALLFAPADDQPPLSEQIARINAEYSARAKQLQEASDVLTKAGGDSRIIGAEFREQRTKLVSTLVTLLKAHKDDAAFIDGLVLLAGPMQVMLDVELSEAALKHRSDPAMGRLCFAMINRGGEAWADRLIEAISADNPNRDVRGQAVFGRAELRRKHALLPIWRRGGQPFDPEQKDRLLTEARGFYSEAAKGYADVKTPDGKSTLGAKASHELARLDNLASLKLGGMAPEIVGEGVDGSKLKLSDYRGKVVVLVFLGSWCIRCSEIMPQLRELAKKYRDRPFTCLGVYSDETRETAKKSVAALGMTWPCYWDGPEVEGPIATEYNIQKWPPIFVLDAKGVIRSMEVRELEDAVETLLKESKDKRIEGQVPAGF
jgi:thiol-disulfide isomerase/thioredoxin